MQLDICIVIGYLSIISDSNKMISLKRSISDFIVSAITHFSKTLDEDRYRNWMHVREFSFFVGGGEVSSTHKRILEMRYYCASTSYSSICFDILLASIRQYKSWTIQPFHFYQSLTTNMHLKDLERISLSVFVILILIPAKQHSENAYGFPNGRSFFWWAK